MSEKGASCERDRDPLDKGREFVFNLMMENAALKAQVETLRECLGLRGRRGIDGGGGSSGGVGAGAAGYMHGHSASRSPPRGRYDPFASQL